MGDKSCVIIYGLDELASAVGRMLLLSGHAVAMHSAVPPDVLRRRMAFSDAWYDGAAVLEGVDARRADRDAVLVSGLRSGMFIPILTQPTFQAIARWPWDVLIDARGLSEGAGRMGLDAELAIVLGPGATAGADCDLVIETGGKDPGAVVRSGPAACPHARDDLEHVAIAPASDVFHAERDIGAVVEAGDLIGFVGAAPVCAPSSGRLRGLRRPGRWIDTGEIVAEVAADRRASVEAIDRICKLIARSVAFTVEMEQQGASMNIWSGRSGLNKKI